MGAVVVVSFISMDGVVQAPLSPDEDRDGGFAHGGWVPPASDDVVNAFMQRATIGAAAMLLGRRTYDNFVAAWARADDSEPAVAAMNRMPKYVVTSSRGDLRWQNSQSVAGDLPHAVADLRGRTDGDVVVFGGATLVQGLAEADLVDAYRLLVFPVVLGAGKRLFGERSRLARFRLADSVISPRGVVILSYVRGTSA